VGPKPTDSATSYLNKETPAPVDVGWFVIG
jgi:hypothetical protein